MASAVDIAWAAGLFEGEGSFTISRAQGQPRVQLAMTDEEPVRKFAAVVGRGNVHRYEGSTEGRKPQWYWAVQGQEDVLSVIALLWPFLCERRLERAYELIERAAKMNDDVGYCKRGHDLSDPRHLYVHRKTGKRHCRTCRAEYQRGWLTRRGN